MDAMCFEDIDALECQAFGYFQNELGFHKRRLCHICKMKFIYRVDCKQNLRVHYLETRLLEYNEFLLITMLTLLICKTCHGI